jgi:small subunit ribosomal protein S16
MVRIRLTRIGKKHRSYFRIGVYDSRTRRDGRNLENLGTYDPEVADKSQKVKLNKERYDYWVSKGAKPTENLKHILKHTGALKQTAAPASAATEETPAEAPAEATADA